MMEDFYTGFEGEPEIRFETKSRGTLHRSVRMWVGYFDDLMDQARPERDGWTGMARAYHEAEGWYDESPWKVPDVGSALMQWKNIDTDHLGRIEKTIHASVLALMCEAFECKDELWIYWE